MVNPLDALDASLNRLLESSVRKISERNNEVNGVIDVTCERNGGSLTLRFPKEAASLAKQFTRYNELLDECSKTREKLIILLHALKCGSWLERKRAEISARRFLDGETETGQ